MLNEKVIVAGFGGQGVMKLGQILTYSGMVEGKEVSWLPSYGPEMRGGTANCNVMVSEKPIASPVIADDATTVIAMNLPSLLKFEKECIEGGNVLINSSLIDKKVEREDVNAYYIPCNEEANKIGNPKIANMVMLGAYIELTKPVKMETIYDALEEIFVGDKAKYIPMNKEALKKGAEIIKEQM